jgi:hypothetical protein
MKPLTIISISIALFMRGAAAGQTYGDGYEPKPPEVFPREYKDYQILPETVSPDHTYAFIYPKRSVLYDLPKYGLFLAALSPFHILARVPTGYSNLAENARNYYAAGWTRDSSTTVFIAGSKWGPDQVWVFCLRDSKVTKQTNLTAEVRQQVLPSFKKSHAKRYNDYFDFIFEDELEDISSWRPDDNDRVIIDTVCTTDPKELDPHRWAVRFKGVWDVSAGKFVEKSFTLIPLRPNQALDRTAPAVRVISVLRLYFPPRRSLSLGR